MTEILKAIRYRNLDDARRHLSELTGVEPGEDPFDDGGSEPQGLLAVIPEDRVGEERFYRLFEGKKGVLVEVEKCPYSGYGPLADESDYMGFVSERTAYILVGCRLPIEIEGCAYGAIDLHHLEALVLDGKHPINRPDVASKLGLAEDWDFEDLFELIVEGRLTGADLDRLIHRGVQ